jgi:hypothetical protein
LKKNMSLKFKRNYPIILSLIAILSFLAFAMGDQRIIAYTVKAESQQTEQVATMRFDITNDIARLVGLPTTQTAYGGSQINDADETPYINSELVNDE